MTYEEALSHAKKEQEAYERKVADGKVFYAKYAEFWKIVVEAIGKQIKYRWHDLRKNPEDLPDDYSYLREQVLFAWHGSDGTTWYECGWFYRGMGGKDVTPYFSVNDCKFMIGDEYRDVFAWRYIEPVEEEEK